MSMKVDGWIMTHVCPKTFLETPQGIDHYSGGYPFDATRPQDVRITSEAEMKKWCFACGGARRGYAIRPATIELRWRGINEQA